MYKIAMLGHQGAGKGTQAELLAKKFGIPVIAPGDMYRREIELGTELGKMARSYVDQGKLAPDELTNEIVKLRLAQFDCAKGFILDGFPRRVNQLALMERLQELTHVFDIEIDDEEAVRRLSGRRVCSKCGATYHVQAKPPKQEGVCDACGGALETRKDDTPEAIRERLDIYHRETRPVIAFYKEKGMVHEINGDQSIAAVHGDIMKAFEV